MKPELEKAVTELIGYVKTGVDFASEQAPLVAREIVLYQTWYTGLGLAGGVALFFFSVVIIMGMMKSGQNGDPDYFMPRFILAGFSFIFSMVAIAGRTAPFIKAITAPRLVVIDYLKGLL